MLFCHLESQSQILYFIHICKCMHSIYILMDTSSFYPFGNIINNIVRTFIYLFLIAFRNTITYLLFLNFDYWVIECFLNCIMQKFFQNYYGKLYSHQYIMKDSFVSFPHQYVLFFEYLIYGNMLVIGKYITVVLICIFLMDKMLNMFICLLDVWINSFLRCFLALLNFYMYFSSYF